MKILIDARPLQTYSKFRGIGRYVNLLIDAFGKDDRFYFLFFKDKNIEFGINNMIFINSPRRGITFTDNFFIPNLLRKNDIDIYHSTVYALPREVKNIKYLLTFYDITPLKFPEFLSKKNSFIYGRILKSSKRADRVISISDKSKRDLMNYTDLKDEKIVIVYPALNFDNKDLNNAINVNLPKNYLLYAGGFDGNKNVETIFKAVNLINYPLIIVGKITETKKKELLNLVDKERRRNIFFTGFVSDDVLQNLYKNAKIFLFPSLYEGFGYPPLEALFHGTPSIVSRCGSLREVMGEAAFYLENPLDFNELSDKITNMLNNLEIRNKILAAKDEVIKKYDFYNFKNKMLGLYLNEI